MKNKHKKRVIKHKRNHVDIFQDTVEALELTVRSARRCAYDLKHCADALIMHRRGGRAWSGGHTDHEMAKIFHERADFFVKLFQSGSAMKEYRHKLYNTIGELEDRVKKYQAILAEHKIADPTPF